MSKESKEVLIICNGLNAMYVSIVCNRYACNRLDLRYLFFMLKELKVHCTESNTFNGTHVKGAESTFDLHCGFQYKVLELHRTSNKVFVV